MQLINTLDLQQNLTANCDISSKTSRSSTSCRTSTKSEKLFLCRVSLKRKIFLQSFQTAWNCQKIWIACKLAFILIVKSFHKLSILIMPITFYINLKTLFNDKAKRVVDTYTTKLSSLRRSLMVLLGKRDETTTQFSFSQSLYWPSNIMRSDRSPKIRILSGIAMPWPILASTPMMISMVSRQSA